MAWLAAFKLTGRQHVDWLGLGLGLGGVIGHTPVGLHCTISEYVSNGDLKKIRGAKISWQVTMKELPHVCSFVKFT